MEKVALVTGSSSGIGLEVVVSICNPLGRSSLLLKIQRGEETSWVTIKFVDNW